MDFFKSYNDRYGHPEGDIALRTIAQALTGRLRQADNIARFGGEEFIFLFPDTDEAQCYQVCESLRQHIEPRQPGGCKLKTAPVRPVVAARPAEYVCSEDLFY
ncbi:GGDEF domain-containing protein [Salmonella enterica]|uniref:GGDEF domain-containing protein n=1 Tax=Salmonella enterica TaxID=28901 RepID=UPI003CC7C8DD